MATYSSGRAWKFSWTEEPGGLQSMGLQRVGHDLVTEQQKEKRAQHANNLIFPLLRPEAPNQAGKESTYLTGDS